MVIYVKICNFAVATGLSVVNRRPADAITEGSCSPARLAALRRTGLRIIGVLRTPAGLSGGNGRLRGNGAGCLRKWGGCRGQWGWVSARADGLCIVCKVKK